MEKKNPSHLSCNILTLKTITYKLDFFSYGAINSYFVLSLKAMPWLWTWNTASWDTGMSWNWLLPHNVFTILFCLFSQWKDNLPAFSKSPAVTPFTFPGMIIRNHHLTECWVCVRQKRQGLHASLQGAPVCPNFSETRKPRLQEADLLSAVSTGPGEDGRWQEQVPSIFISLRQCRHFSNGSRKYKCSKRPLSRSNYLPAEQ